MEICQAYKTARIRWKKRYTELERRCHEAEQAENWNRVEVIGEELVRMEQHSGFKKCVSCRKKGCPAQFDGFASWEPMDSNCATIKN